MRAMMLVCVVVAGCGRGDERLLGPRAEPIGLLKQLRYGMTDTELVDVFPDLQIECESDACRGRIKKGRLTYRFNLRPISRKLYEMGASFADKNGDAVVKAWGDSPANERGPRFYTNAAGTGCAWVETNHGETFITYNRALKLDALIDPDSFSVGGIELLDRSLDQLRSATSANAYDMDHDSIHLPPTELGGPWTAIAFATTEGKLTRYSVALYTSHVPGARERIKAMLSTRFGTPKRVETAFGVELLYGARVKVAEKDFAPDSTAVWVRIHSDNDALASLLRE